MDDHVDLRQQLYNEGLQGPVQRIQLPRERITRLNGILFDLDPKLLVPNNLYFPPADDPRAFYEAIRPVLERHPLACHAEVRNSGTGLHAIVWLQPAVELHTAEEQAKWSAIVKAVQCTLPSDPDAPGITALTRALGSINGKNGATVEVIKVGQPVSPLEVETYLQQLVKKPFQMVTEVLFGSQRVVPCPVCEGPRTRLDALDHMGRCYGGCSKVSLEQLYDVLMQPLGCVKRLEQACS